MNIINDIAPNLDPLNKYRAEKALALNENIAGGSVRIEFQDLIVMAPKNEVYAALVAIQDDPIKRKRIMKSIKSSLKEMMGKIKKGTYTVTDFENIAPDIALWYANEICEGRAPIL